MGDRAIIVNDGSHRSPVNTMHIGMPTWGPGNNMSASYGSTTKSPGNITSASASYKTMTMHGENGSYSAMEQQMYQAESKSDFSIRSSGGTTSYHSESLNRYPKNATSEIRQLDANQNQVLKSNSLDSKHSRRVQSESTSTTMHDMTTSDRGERSTVQITGPPQTMIVSEKAVAEIKGGGTTSMTSEVRRRGGYKSYYCLDACIYIEFLCQ